jgi:hypothetical protein
LSNKTRGFYEDQVEISYDISGNIVLNQNATKYTVAPSGSGGGSGVTSLNTFVGSVSINAGSGIVLNNSNGVISITGTGGGGATISAGPNIIASTNGSVLTVSRNSSFHKWLFWFHCF